MATTTKISAKNTNKAPEAGEQGDEVTRMRADRKALDTKIKAAAAQQRADNAAKKAAAHKTLAEVIASEPTNPKAWSNTRTVGTGAARVLARVKAGQQREEALDQVLAAYRVLILAELDQRDREQAAQK